MVLESQLLHLTGGGKLTSCAGARATHKRHLVMVAEVNFPKEVASGLSLKVKQGSCRCLPGFIFSFLYCCTFIRLPVTTRGNTHPGGSNDR